MALTANTTRYYRLKAVNAGGESAWTGTINATTWPNKPAAPTGFKKVGTKAIHQLTLDWSAIPGATSYKLARSTDASNWNVIYEGGGLTFTDTGVTDYNKRYYYRLCASNIAGDSDWSPWVYADKTTRYFWQPVPQPPKNLQVEVLSSTSVKLTWEPGDDVLVQSYGVELSPAGAGTWAPVTYTASTTPTYTITGLSPDTDYDFRVRTCGVEYEDYNNQSHVEMSTYATVSAKTTAGIPGVPTGFTATPVSQTQIHIQWNGVITATGYVLEKSDDGTNWTPAYQGPNTSFDDT